MEQTKQQNQNSAPEKQSWQAVEPSVFKPVNAGDHIIGRLVSKEPKDEAANLSARYYLEHQGETHLVWGSAVLDDRMQFVNTGEVVRITYKDKIKNKRNQDMNLYTVEVAKDRDEVADEKSDETSEVVEETVV